MIRWVLAGFPGACVVSLLLVACVLPFAGLHFASLVGGGAALLFVVLWAEALPRWAITRCMGRMVREDDPLLGHSWQRAFDGLPDPGISPQIQVWKSPVPALLVLRAAGGRPVILVSRGWLFERGEEAFREACRRSVDVFKDRALQCRSRAAFVLSCMVRSGPLSFWTLGFMPRSEALPGIGLSPVSLALSLPLLVWMRWIAAVTLGVGALRQRTALIQGPGRRPAAFRVDWAGRKDAWLSPLEQILSLELPASGNESGKSILSWIPARW